MKYTSANTNTPIDCVYKDVVIIGKYSMNEKLKIKHTFVNACARREYIVYHFTHQNKPNDDDHNNNNNRQKKKRNENKNAQMGMSMGHRKKVQMSYTHSLIKCVYLWKLNNNDKHKKGMK